MQTLGNGSSLEPAECWRHTACDPATVLGVGSRTRETLPFSYPGPPPKLLCVTAAGTQTTALQSGKELRDRSA